MNFARFIILLCWALAAGCSSRKNEPPPPAGSAAVPVAAPGARGTLAAGKAPAPGLRAPSDPDDEDVEPEPEAEDPLAPPTAVPSTPDAGVSL